MLTERKHSIRYVEAPTTDLRQLDALAPDLLVVLGGPIGVYENDRYPFVDAEIALLQRRLAAGKPTLGICLGSQLMAKALGARVYPSGIKELGWAPLDLTREGSASCLSHLVTPVLHWHGDTFDLFRSEPCCSPPRPHAATQAFSAGRHALGLQFHAEACGQPLEAWFVGHACEIAGTPTGQRPAATRRDPASQRGART